MVTFVKNDLSDVCQYKILDGGSPLSYSKVCNLIKTSETFRNEFISTLRNSNFSGFFWEVKPCNIHTFQSDFEFVLIDGCLLDNFKSNGAPFEKYFNSTESVVAFHNKGKDALLVVPTPKYSTCNYAHFATFLRTGEQNQIHDFFIKISNAYLSKINEHPIWLSTAGLGVHWLHVRIDSSPKYYKYKKYKNFSVA